MQDNLTPLESLRKLVITFRPAAASPGKALNQVWKQTIENPLEQVKG